MGEEDQGELRHRRSSQEEPNRIEDALGEQVIASRPVSVVGTADRGALELPSTISPSTKIRFSVDRLRDTSTVSVAEVPSEDGPSNSSRPIGPDRSANSINTSLGADKSLAHRGSSTSHRRTPSSSIASSLSKSLGKRNRGYSLRRSLFNRNILESGTGESSVIELAESSSSRQSELSKDRNFVGKDEKASSKADVSIRAISSNEEDEDKIVRTIEQSRYKEHPIPTYDAWVRKGAARLGIFRTIRECYQNASRLILRIHEIPPSKDGRQIDLDILSPRVNLDERTGRPYMDNSIRSSRYTLWNFLPRQLFFQFSKLANFYFLCVSIMQMIPGLSTTGTYTTIIPLLFFVSISMAKEGFDDLRRYRLDKVENRKEIDVLIYSVDPQSPLLWMRKMWKDVAVGDVIRLQRNDASPADILLLRAAGPNGLAYVETMALDGETNLKSKRVTPTLAKSWANVDQAAPPPAHVVVQDPNDDLYTFDGRVAHFVDGQVASAENTCPLTNGEIVYRGSILRNTPEAFGMVVYTGEECKIRMNANKKPRIKAPNLQRKTNSIVILIVIFVVALAVFEMVAYEVWSEDTEEHSWYLQNAGVPFVQIFAGFIVMFNTMIPLSLYVSLEIVKLAQIFLMQDVDLYDSKTDTPLEPRTSTINEDLGQIRFVP